MWRSARRSARIGIVSVLCGMTACSDYVFHEYEEVDVFAQEAAEELDILLVVDNSASMQPYQEELSEHFLGFLTWLVDAEVDYHIGVVTTDTISEGAGEIGGEVVTTETEDPETVFASIVNVGIQGTGTEMGLDAARLALEEPQASGANAGFRRTNAYQTAVFVSDEDDSSPLSVPDYVAAFVALSGNRRDAFNASTLTVLAEGTCGEEGAMSHMGARYLAVVEATGGVAGDICQADFTEVIKDISMSASRLRDTFFLTSPPKVESLEVEVDRAVVPCDSGAWRFAWVENRGVEEPAIVFSESALPGLHSQITVRYNHGGGDESQNCTEVGDR